MREVAFVLLAAGLLVLLLGCQVSNRWPSARPPMAKYEPVELEQHGHVRTDPYYWMRDRDDPDVRAYLEAENRYTEEMMAHTERIRDTLFEEFKGRIKQEDQSAPYFENGYYYYQRIADGAQYPVYCRRKGALEAPEEVMLDVGRLAEGHEYCAVRGREVSPNNEILAYAVDFTGRRFYDIRFRDLSTGKDREEVIPDVTPAIAWANDSATLFYTRQHPETLRSYQVSRHRLGTDPVEDVLVYEESDETFDCEVSKSKSQRYIMIHSDQTLSDEVRYLDADNPESALRVVQPRQRELEYDVAHAGEHFYIRTNHDAKNFRLMRAPVTAPGIEHWEEVVAHRDDVLLEDFDVFEDYLVLEQRMKGLPQIRVRNYSGETDYYIDFTEPAYEAYTGNNAEFASSTLRYYYSSMTTPDSAYDYDMNTRERILRKRDEVGGGFDPANYDTERLFVPSRDDLLVPVSLVYRKDLFEQNATSPILVSGYGSYGISSDLSFNPFCISLLDGGFLYAIAHVRGGSELGRQWYEDGKLLKKNNTFTDFIDCTDYLVEHEYADPAKVFASGGSAGGLLVGALVNMRPELFRGVIAEVPFVDVVTTMLDDSIPLTTSEYDEWGDPRKQEYYEYMLSYSPYDNVEKRAYPHMLVTAAFEDSQVQYWEPAKWVAKLRARKRDHTVLLLKTEMEGSHTGVSGRDSRYREIAFRYAFLMELAGTWK